MLYFTDAFFLHRFYSIGLFVAMVGADRGGSMVGANNISYYT